MLRYAVFHSDRFPSSVLTVPAKSIHKKDNFFRMDFLIRPTVGLWVLSNDYQYINMYNYLNISEVFEKKNQISEAYKFYKLYTQVKDSIVNEEKYKQIAELETKYETEKKEQEIKLLNVDNELQRNRVKQARLVIYFISGGGILIIFFLIIVYKQFLDKRKANLKLKAQNKLIQKQKNDITDNRS